MSTGLKVWLNSGANHASCNTQILTWQEAGITEADFDELSDEGREDFAKDLAFAFSDWGFVKIGYEMEDEDEG